MSASLRRDIGEAHSDGLPSQSQPLARSQQTP